MPLNWLETVWKGFEGTVNPARIGAWEALTKALAPDKTQPAWRDFPLDAFKKKWLLPSPKTPVVAELSQFQDGVDRLVFVDGKFSPGQSILVDWKVDSQSKSVPTPQSAFELLYQTFPASELWLTACSNRPLVIHHVQSEAQVFSPFWLHVQIPEGLSSHVMEVWSGNEEAWSGLKLKVHVETEAELEWLSFQPDLATHLSFREFHLAEKSKLHASLVQVNAQASRSEMDVYLEGVGANASVDGISFVQGKDQLENQVRLHHVVGETISSQTFKTVLRDRARSIFTGKILIPRNSQKSDARQRHQSLVFHPTAEAVTRPELEVEADDVKAAHGATIGRLNSDELFYLETRGISRADATALLARAFVEDILLQIAEPRFYQFIDGALFSKIAVFLKDLEQI